MEMYRKTYAEINLDHLAHNVRVLQSSFPATSFLCPMVKANAYGHGDVVIARFLEKMGIKHLGVCLIEEGLLLRNFGVKTEILVFRGFDLEGAEKIIQYQLTPVVSSWEQLQYLETVASSPVNIHLKFDTGMSRLGFHPEEAQLLYNRLWQNKKIRLKALATHLSHGEDALSEGGVSAQQLKKIHQVSQVFKAFNVFTHTLNSSGVLSLMQAQGTEKKSHPLLLENWGLRPGLMIYGYSPLDGVQYGELSNLKAVMTLKSVVSTFRQLAPGGTVSYSGTWKAAKDSVIAVVPIGYADGYHRALSNQALALFNGFRVPVVGNVCMDYLMLDVSEAVRGHELASLREQEVVLFGYDSLGGFLSAAELADQAKTITWEILTSVGERVPRRYKGSDAFNVYESIGGE